MTGPAGSEFVIELAARVTAAIGPRATSAPPARSSNRCTVARASKDPASISTPARTHPQRRWPMAVAATASSLFSSVSWSKTRAASPSPMTYLATGQARATRARHGAGAVMFPRVL